MNDCRLSLARLLVTGRDANVPVASHRGRIYHFTHFQGAVAELRQRIEGRPEPRWALYCDDAYPFAVALFALLHAGKEVWLPGNQQPGTAEALSREGVSLIGDWSADAPRIPLEAQPREPPAALDPGQSRLAVYTSGSTGRPKLIPKRLFQLDNEVATLEATWGDRLGPARILGTVSHQHIYGLLFRVLWPLAAGRLFYSQAFRDPAALLQAARQADAVWVASPAHLKRLPPQPAWRDRHRLRMIFSSGGPLPRAAALRLLDYSGQAAMEVYGSSETGGIAWRQQKPENDDAWTPFAGVEFAQTADGALQLRSPHLADAGWLTVEDRIEPTGRGRFRLGVRADRIVKIEEKRVSLPAVETHLSDIEWVEDAYALALPGKRLTLGVVAVLTRAGRELLEAKGKKTLAHTLRQALARWFEPVCLPRKWRFVEQLPVNDQGKIEQEKMLEMFAEPKRRFPDVLGRHREDNRVELQLSVPADLACFPGHFPGVPILPGVVQLYWAEHYGRELLDIALPFSHMETVKFMKLIRPGDRLSLQLEWEANKDLLRFSFSSDAGRHSSGRICFGAGDG